MKAAKAGAEADGFLYTGLALKVGFMRGWLRPEEQRDPQQEGRMGEGEEARAHRAPEANKVRPMAHC